MAHGGEMFPWTNGALRWLWPAAPRRRRILVVLAGLLLLLLLLHLGLDATAARRLAGSVRLAEGRYGPLDPATLAPPPVADADNRAKAIRAAAELAPAPDPMLSRFASFEEAGPSPELRAAISGVVLRNQIVLGLLDEARRRQASNWNVTYEDGVEARIPPLLQILNLAKLNAAAGRLALLEGRTADAVTAVSRGAAIAESMRQEPVLIMQLIRIAIDTYGLRLAREIVAAGPPGVPEVAEMEEAFRDRSPRDSLHASLVAEVKEVFAMFPPNGGTGRALYADVPMLIDNRFLSWLLRPAIRDNARFYLDSMVTMIDYQAVPRPERLRRFGASPARPSARPWHVVAEMLLPNLLNAIDRADLWEARFAVARVGLALERHRLARGEYPASLDALVPEFLAALPSDPFTGAPPEYRREAAGYLLRSDADGKDFDLVGNPDTALRWAVRR